MSLISIDLHPQGSSTSVLISHLIHLQHLSEDQICFRGTVQVQQCLKELRPQQLQVELAIYLESNNSNKIHITACYSTSAAFLWQEAQRIQVLPKWYHRAPLCLAQSAHDEMVKWMSQQRTLCFLPKGLQFSLLLHIPHIFTCVKRKQLCHIFSLTS